MMQISEALAQIQEAVYGREVRQAIHDGIKRAYDDASSGGNTNMEVSMARGQFNNLNSRLQSIDGNIKKNEQQYDDLDNSKIDKNGSGQVTWANISQGVREQISGEKVSIVGKDAVITENIANNSVTSEKIADNQIGREKLNESFSDKGRLFNSTDINTVTTEGVYFKLSGASPQNSPRELESLETVLIVKNNYLSSTSSLISQTIIPSTSETNVYVRTFKTDDENIPKFKNVKSFIEKLAIEKYRKLVAGNLFAGVDIERDKFIHQSTGIIGDAARHVLTDHIEVKPDTTYVFENNHTWNALRVVELDENKNYVTGTTNLAVTTKLTVKTASSTKYIRVSAITEGSHGTFNDWIMTEEEASNQVIVGGNGHFESISTDALEVTGDIPVGTLENLPDGLVKGDMWADISDSSEHPVVRVML